MGLVYFDSSALLRLLVDEPGSDVAAMVWNAGDLVATSELATVEVPSGLAGASRAGRLTPQQLAETRDDWESLATAVSPIRLSTLILRTAAELVDAHPLSAGDAIHLASALTLSPEYVVMVSWDQRLRGAARSYGMGLAPAV